MATHPTVNKLSLNLNKGSTRANTLVPEPPTEDQAGTYGNPYIDELAKRLSNLEGAIDLKVDGDQVISRILLTQEAVLIQSDKIGVLGDVTFADFVRDQNGTSTGVIDPNVTRIVGDKITTGSITSNNWDTDQGSKYNLDDGDIQIGGSANPALNYDGLTRIFTVRGQSRIADEMTGPTIDQHGYFATGTATYNTVSNTVTGTGILMGTPGIYFVKNDVVVAQFNIDEGFWIMEGSLTTITGDGGTTSTSSDNATQLAYDAQRTADIAVMTILDHLYP